MRDFSPPAAAEATAAANEDVLRKRARVEDTCSYCPCALNHSFRCGKHSLFRSVLNRQLHPMRTLFSRHNLTWQWIAYEKLASTPRSSVSGALDCGFLPGTTLPKRTISSLHFSPTNGEFILAANMDRVSLFSFDLYRLEHGKGASVVELAPELDFFESDRGTLLGVENVRWNTWNEGEFIATFPASKQVRVMDIESGIEVLKQQLTTSPGFPTCAEFVQEATLVVGTSSGRLLGFDTRAGGKRCIFSFDHAKQSAVVSLAPQTSSGASGNFLVAFRNGEIGEFGGTRQVQQAFSNKLPILNQTKQCLARVGILAMASVPRSRDVCVFGADGSIHRFNPLTFSFGTPIKPGEDRAQTMQFFVPQPTVDRDMNSQSQQDLLNFANCVGFGQQSGQVFSVRQAAINIVDVYDLDVSPRRRLYEQGEENLIASMEFKRNISALAIHPDSDVLVAALHKQSLLEVRGLV